VVVTKNIVNVIKMGLNVLHRVDVLVAKIQKTPIIGKKLEKNMNVVRRIVFILLKIKFLKKIFLMNFKLEINIKEKNLKKKEKEVMMEIIIIFIVINRLKRMIK
jgi:hypothetical protein